MMPAEAPSIIAKSIFLSRAYCLGERIDTKGMSGVRLANRPPVFSVGATGVAVVFRFGAVVLYDVDEDEASSFLEGIKHLVHDPLSTPETEEVEMRVVAPDAERVGNGTVRIRAADVERLQLVADALAKSVALSRFEARVGEAFDSVEPLAVTLSRRARVSPRTKSLVRRIGATLLAEHQMVWRVEVVEKPDLLWDRPDLERLYAALQDEYELTERYKALEHKLELLNRTASTLLDLLHNRRALRVEWYIVALIVIEIVISLFDILVGFK